MPPKTSTGSASVPGPPRPGSARVAPLDGTQADLKDDAAAPLPPPSAEGTANSPVGKDGRESAGSSPEDSEDEGLLRRTPVADVFEDDFINNMFGDGLDDERFKKEDYIDRQNTDKLGEWMSFAKLGMAVHQQGYIYYAKWYFWGCALPGMVLAAITSILALMPDTILPEKNYKNYIVSAAAATGGVLTGVAAFWKWQAESEKHHATAKEYSALLLLIEKFVVERSLLTKYEERRQKFEKDAEQVLSKLETLRREAGPPPSWLKNIVRKREQQQTFDELKWKVEGEKHEKDAEVKITQERNNTKMKLAEEEVEMQKKRLTLEKERMKGKKYRRAQLEAEIKALTQEREGLRQKRMKQEHELEAMRQQLELQKQVDQEKGQKELETMRQNLDRERVANQAHTQYLAKMQHDTQQQIEASLQKAQEQIEEAQYKEREARNACQKAQEEAREFQKACRDAKHDAMEARASFNASHCSLQADLQADRQQYQRTKEEARKEIEKELEKMQQQAQAEKEASQRERQIAEIEAKKAQMELQAQQEELQALKRQMQDFSLLAKQKKEEVEIQQGFLSVLNEEIEARMVISGQQRAVRPVGPQQLSNPLPMVQVDPWQLSPPTPSVPPASLPIGQIDASQSPPKTRRQDEGTTVEMSIENVDFHKLDRLAKDDLEFGLRRIIARWVSVTNDDVSVTLQPGSVKVIAKVNAPQGHLMSLDKDILCQAVLQMAKSIDGVRKAAVGELTVTKPKIHEEKMPAYNYSVMPPQTTTHDAQELHSMLSSDFMASSVSRMVSSPTSISQPGVSQRIYAELAPIQGLQDPGSTTQAVQAATQSSSGSAAWHPVFGSSLQSVRGDAAVDAKAAIEQARSATSAIAQARSTAPAQHQAVAQARSTAR